MNLKSLKAAAAGLALICSASVAQAADWAPSGPIKFLISFQAGGGVDTSSRLLAEELSARHGWEIIPENMAGRGGALMAAALKDEPADGLAIGMVPTESLTYAVQAVRNPGYALEDFTFIATVTGTQLALMAKADRGWKDIGDVIEAAKAGEAISAGAMSPKLADGIYVLGKANGVEFNTVMVKGGKGGLNGIIADDLDIAWGAGVQTKAVLAGDLVNLVNAESKPLRISPDIPHMADYGVPFDFGSKFMVMAPAGIPDEARQTLANAIVEIVNDPESKVNQFVTKAFSGPETLSGAELDAHIQDQFDQASALLEASAE